MPPFKHFAAAKGYGAPQKVAGATTAAFAAGTAVID